MDSLRLWRILSEDSFKDLFLCPYVWVRSSEILRSRSWRLDVFVYSCHWNLKIFQSPPKYQLCLILSPTSRREVWRTQFESAGVSLTRVSYLKRVMGLHVVRVVKSARISANLAGFMLYKKKIIPSNILGYSFSCCIIELNITPQSDKMGKLKSFLISISLTAISLVWVNFFSIHKFCDANFKFLSFI